MEEKFNSVHIGLISSFFVLLLLISIFIFLG